MRAEALSVGDEEPIDAGGAVLPGAQGNLWPGALGADHGPGEGNGQPPDGRAEGVQATDAGRHCQGAPRAQRGAEAFLGDVMLVDRGRGVPSTLEEFDQGHLVLVKPVTVSADAVMARIPPGHQRRARRLAHRVLDIVPLKADALPRQPVDGRRVDQRIAGVAERVVAQVVGGDEKDVGLCGHLVRSRFRWLFSTGTSFFWVRVDKWANEQMDKSLDRYIDIASISIVPHLVFYRQGGNIGRVHLFLGANLPESCGGHRLRAH